MELRPAVAVTCGLLMIEEVGSPPLITFASARDARDSGWSSRGRLRNLWGDARSGLSRRSYQCLMKSHPPSDIGRNARSGFIVARIL